MSEPLDIPIEHQLVVRSLMGQTLAGAAADRLAAMSREMFFPSGTVIYEAGEPARFIHFILEGRVELVLEGRPPWTFGERGVIGILDAELDRPHARTARALADVRVIAIRTEDWQELMEDTFEFTRRRLERNAEDLLRRGLLLSPHGGFEGVPVEHRTEERLLAACDKSAPGAFDRLLVLYLTDLFERAGVQALLRVAEAAEERRFSEGEWVVREGDPATAILVVAEGEVAMSRAEPPLSATFGAGRLVGGYAGVAQAKWPVTVRSLAPTRLLSVSYEDLFDVMEDHGDLVRSVMAFLANERERLQVLLW